MDFALTFAYLFFEQLTDPFNFLVFYLLPLSAKLVPLLKINFLL